MFDIGWSELLIIGIVALIVIGPKELPGALRALGQWMGKIRRMASEFQNQFHEAMREAELADLKKEVDEMTAKAQGYAHFDPIEDVRKDIENAVEPPPSLDTPATQTPPAAPTTADVASAPLPAADSAASEQSPAGNAVPSAADPAKVAEAAPAPPETAPDGPKLDTPKPDAGRAA
jgi:sec-independent protein translocase protein TatB